MSDSDDDRGGGLGLQLHERLSKVTPELLSEFLYSRGVPVVKCLMCGSEDIGVPLVEIDQYQDGKKYYVDYVKVGADGPRNSLMHYQYRLICRNCGFTSNIAVWPALKWVEEEKGGSDGK